MYCNLGKSQVIPLVFRISSHPKHIKPSQTLKFQSLSNGVFPKPSKNSSGVELECLSHGVCSKTSENSPIVKPRNFSSRVYGETQELSDGLGMKSRNLSGGFRLRNPIQGVGGVRKRNFSSGSLENTLEGDNGVRRRKNLPWIAAYKNKDGRISNRAPVEKASRSSWEESANRFVPRNDVGNLDENVERRNRYVPRNDISNPAESVERRNRLAEMVEPRGDGSMEGDESGAGEEEIVNDPRWDRIKSRYRRLSDRDAEPEKPEVRRWNRQETWGRNTLKEASESSVPYMTGEGIYGVGPVLAALSAGRREFFALYVQAGLDLSKNNRKKKDKKGFEKILKTAEKIGLTIKEVSKHDLNMVVDNRPHQGLVLDASLLDLVNIRELDPPFVEGEMGPLWVALDEVTDPQNLGAIIRSSYFFGAAGVVVCVKNSAPLSGVVSKASAGSLELMELRSCKNMMQFLSSSAENGWRVLGGSVSSRAISLNEVPAGTPTILVLGSEGKGLRPLVERSCTDLVRIPGNTPVDIVSAVGSEDEKTDEVDRSLGEEFRSFMAVESLNVSVAAGVLLHHLIGNNNSNVEVKQASVPPESLTV